MYITGGGVTADQHECPNSYIVFTKKITVWKRAEWKTRDEPFLVKHSDDTRRPDTKFTEELEETNELTEKSYASDNSTNSRLLTSKPNNVTLESEH